MKKISVQVLFQWNDLNHDVDRFFLHCRHVDLISPCLRRYYAEVLGLLVPDFFSLFFLGLFFLLRPTDPKSGNA